MDLQALKCIIERVETGCTTATDAEALRALFRRELTPCPASSPREEAHHRDATSQRVGSAAVVAVNFVRDRYARGEVQVQASYRLRGGGCSTDRATRVGIGDCAAPFIRELWTVVFDAVALAQQFEPDSVVIKLNCRDLGDPWRQFVRATAEITALELRVLVAGTAPDPRGGGTTLRKKPA
jgi:hypothetical protein